MIEFPIIQFLLLINLYIAMLYLPLKETDIVMLLLTLDLIQISSSLKINKLLVFKLMSFLYLLRKLEDLATGVYSLPGNIQFS